MTTIALLIMLINSNSNYLELKLTYQNPNSDYTITQEQAEKILTKHEWSDVSYKLYVDDLKKERFALPPNAEGSIRYTFFLKDCVLIIRGSDLKSYVSDIAKLADSKPFSNGINNSHSLAVYGEFVNNGRIIGDFKLFRDESNKAKKQYSEYASIFGDYYESSDIIGFINKILDANNVKDEYAYIGDE